MRPYPLGCASRRGENHNAAQSKLPTLIRCHKVFALHAAKYTDRKG